MKSAQAKQIVPFIFFNYPFYSQADKNKADKKNILSDV